MNLYLKWSNESFETIKKIQPNVNGAEENFLQDELLI